MVGAIAAPVLIGAAMGAKRRFRRIASESGGQPLRTEDTARAVVSGAFVGGLTGAALTAAVAALIEVRG